MASSWFFRAFIFPSTPAVRILHLSDLVGRPNASDGIKYLAIRTSFIFDLNAARALSCISFYS
jgi:hypothetical protein